VGVETRADRSTAEGQLGQRALNPFQPLHAQLDLPGMAAECLAKPDGNRILKMGASYLDDVLKGRSLFLKGFVKDLECWQECLIDGG